MKRKRFMVLLELKFGYFLDNKKIKNLREK